jgi:phosphoglycerol transferase MdoB-like AlkP superfamily enzyme
MKYPIIMLILILLIHPLSFAKYNWDNNNKTAAIGTVLISLVSLILPFYILFLR